jgi:mono/diheme cytochrome c family protein
MVAPAVPSKPRTTSSPGWSLRFLLVASALLVLLGSGWAQNAEPAGGSAKNKSNQDAVTRGKYIVEDVAVCSQCHTPRNSDGTPDRTKWLEGASLWLKPAQPTENWPLEAPRIAGTPPGSDADMVKLLTTGIWQNGTTLRPPMPQFRMSAQDAEAVVAYLRSLTQSPR